MSPVTDVVNEYKNRIEAVHESNRGSQRSGDLEILDLIEGMAVHSVKEILAEFGQPARDEESAERLFERASGAIVDNPGRFDDGSPLKFFSRRVLGLNQVLRDISYLRQGYGLGSERPIPADMKWNHSSSVESYVWDLMSQLVDALKADGGEIHRLIPEVKVDLASTRSGIIDLLGQSLGPGDFMDEVIELGKAQTRVAGWEMFRELPYVAELEVRSAFFTEVVTREPPAFPIAGFYAGIAYRSQRGETIADLQLMGSDSYQPHEEEWFDQINYSPKRSYAHSEVLASVYRMAYAPGGLDNAADYTLCLAWGTYLARACAYRYLAEFGSDFVGLRMGFGGGDWIDLGWVRPL